MQAYIQPPQTRYIRRPDVEALTGLSCSSIYRMMGDGEFPKPIKLTKKAVAWAEIEILDWLANRPVAA